MSKGTNEGFFGIPVKLDQQSNKSEMQESGIAEIVFTERSKLFEKNTSENPF